MHDNVNISKELQETKHMFDNVLLAQGRLKSGTRTGSHTDERLSEISSNILNKVDFHLAAVSGGFKWVSPLKPTMHSIPRPVEFVWRQ